MVEHRFHCACSVHYIGGGCHNNQIRFEQGCRYFLCECGIFTGVDALCISEIRIFTGSLINNIFWENLTEKKRTKLTEKMKRLSKKLAAIDYQKPARTKTTYVFHVRAAARQCALWGFV